MTPAKRKAAGTGAAAAGAVSAADAQPPRDPAASRFAGSIIAHRNDRMGGRIVALLNAMRLSQDLGLPFWVFWPTEGLTSPEMKVPGDIFHAEFMAAHFAPNDEMRRLYNALIGLGTVDPAMTRDAFLAEAARGRSFLSDRAMEPEVLPWEDEARVRARLPAVLRSIAFNPTVAATMERIDGLLAGTRPAAYHIRRGDIIRSPKVTNRLWPTKYVPRIFYEVHLEGALAAGDARIVIFSDEPREVASFTAMDPAVLSFDDLLGPTTLSVAQRDFLELYAMSRCGDIFGPAGSAFSSSAALIGNGTVTPVEHAIGAEGRDRALARLSDRVEYEPQLFHGHGDLGQNLPFILDWHREKGTEPVARGIMAKVLERGFDLAYIYPLLARSMFEAGDVDGCLRVRELAAQRPVYLEDVYAEVNCLAALSSLIRGDTRGAVRLLHAAQWFGPLDGMGQRASHLMYSMKLLDERTYFPFDPALMRNRTEAFGEAGAGFKRIEALARATQEGGGTLWYPFDLPVRDWQLIQGKKLSRAYSNHSKIARRIDLMERSYSKMADHPAVLGALGTLHRARGDAEGARRLLEQSLALAPDNPLYLKRLADWHFDRSNVKKGLSLLEQASAAAPESPAYRGELVARLLNEKLSSQAAALALDLAQEDHDFPELRLIAARALRTDRKQLDAAMAEVDKGLASVHGAASLLNMKAMIHTDRGDHAAAARVYAQLLDWGRPPEMVVPKIDRLKVRVLRSGDAAELAELLDETGLAAALERAGPLNAT